MKSLFSAGYPLSELPTLLLVWAETNHPDAYRHIGESLAKPGQVRRTLAAIYRRMAKDGGTPPLGDAAEGEPDQAEPVSSRSWAERLAEAEQNDPESLSMLRPYIDRDESAMAELDAADAAYRGMQDETDRAVVAEVFS